MKMMNVMAAVAVSIGFSGIVQGEIADFYISDAQGQIYTVDGATLAATEVFEISGGMAINDIIYVGDNKMLANVTDQLIQYDMTTGIETVIFDTADVVGQDEIYFTSGFAGTSNNDIFFSVWAISPDRNEQFGATYNPFTQTYTELAVIQPNPGLYFDHFEIGENTYLGADFVGERIRVLNSLTGEDVAIYDAGFAPVSFLETNGQIFSMTRDGELYTFDVDTGVSAFYGNISGFSGDLLGATNSEIFRIPTPGTLSLLGLMGLAAARRRR